MGAAAALVGGCWSCGSAGQAQSATASLQAAATATARATSFTLLVEGVEVTYQSPDRVEQVEHGQASASSSSSGGAATTSGPYAETITKVFIGDHYYEDDSPSGQTPTFSVSQRCAGDTNAADYVLGILGAMATSGNIRASGDGFAFQIPKGGAVPFALSGTPTVAGGYVKTIKLNPGAGRPVERRENDSAGVRKMTVLEAPIGRRCPWPQAQGQHRGRNTADCHQIPAVATASAPSS